ncbi:MAG: hypothetical protein SAJ12_15550 [Jaaginema sp. PMC 1079.18]|nr:hypothetical protein [Jaaginema sp. PMC 1080.18]MEC4852398.1 hypothetical protein [Jaaginema sp. PMC 1079.18]MEC4864584.1 hypothetical protein [Jaaginema sp. PMC 1078.18]
MMFKPVNRKNGLDRAYLKVAGVICAIAILGFSIVGHYGVSWDESLEIGMVKNNFDLIAKGKPLPTDLKHYGVLFNLSAEVAFQATQFAKQGLDYDPLADSRINVDNDQANFQDIVYQRLRDRIAVKHPFTFLVALITYIAVAALVGILAGKQYAWFAPIILALFPRFWGHSFFNPKDIPFAAMFTLGTLASAYLVAYYLKQEEKNKTQFGANKITLTSLLYGVLIGLVTSTRIGGFFLLFHFGLTHLLLRVFQGNFLEYVRRFWKFYLLIGFAWGITTTILHPASWSNPVIWFIATLKYLSAHVRDSGDFFMGQNWSSQDLPWYYLLRWIAISIPVFFQVFFWVGLILIIFKFKSFNPLQKATVILVLLQICLIPAIAILRDSTIYGGMRQFLFILPGVAVITSSSLLWIYQILQPQFLRWFAVGLTAVLLSIIIVDMVALHPYEYSYFNRAVGGIAQAGKYYDTDYWGTSLSEGMKWLNENGKPNSTVLVGGSFHSARIYADSQKFTLYEMDNPEQKLTGNPDYYLTLHKWNLPEKYSECQTIHEIQRQGIILTSIKQCR